MSRGRPKNENAQSEVNLLAEHFEENQNGKLVPSSSAIFQQLGKVLNKQPKAVYLAARRHFTEITPNTIQNASDVKIERSEAASSSSADENAEPGVIIFHFQIDADNFLLETYAKKARKNEITLTRPKTGWADKLFELVWQQKKCNCAWTFRHSYVRADGSIVFDGHCTECQAIFHGTTNTNRTTLYVRISGYKQNYIHLKRRRLHGERREKVVESLKNKSAINVHRKLAEKYIDDPNEGVSPLLPTSGAIRQTKYVTSIEEGKSAVQNISTWKNTSTSFKNIINDIGYSPFFVKYQLPLQF